MMNPVSEVHTTTDSHPPPSNQSDEIKQNVKRLLFVVGNIQIYGDKIEKLEREIDEMRSTNYQKKFKYVISPKVARRLHTKDWQKAEKDVQNDTIFVEKIKIINSLLAEAAPFIEERKTLQESLNFG